MKKTQIILMVILIWILSISAQGCKTKVRGTTALEGQVNGLADNLNGLGSDVSTLSGNLTDLDNNLDTLGGDLNQLSIDVSSLNTTLNSPPPATPVPALPQLTYQVEILDVNYTQSPIREVQNDYHQEVMHLKVTATTHNVNIQDTVVALSQYLPNLELVHQRDYSVIGYGKQAGSVQTIEMINSSMGKILMGTSETFIIRANLSNFKQKLNLTCQLTGIQTQFGFDDITGFNLNDEMVVVQGPKASIAGITSTSYTLSKSGVNWQTVNRLRITDLGNTGLVITQTFITLTVPTTTQVELRIVDENDVVVGVGGIDYWQPQPNETIYWVGLYPGVSVPNLSGVTLRVQVNVTTATLPASFGSRVNWLWCENPVNRAGRYATTVNLTDSTITVIP